MQAEYKEAIKRIITFPIHNITIFMKISIITICYNRASTIADCIESVLCQKYHNIEYIVIDGGSNDGTVEIIEKYRDKLATFISEPDSGMYHALNKGISLATGEIIGILHSDDLYYCPNTINKVMAVFNQTKADLVYANGQYVDKKDTNLVRRIYKGKPFNKRYLRFGWIPLHTTIYVRRELFDKYGMYKTNYQIASDYGISLRWFMNDSIKKEFLNEWVVKMRLGGKSTTMSLQRQKSNEDLDIIKGFNLYGYFTLGFKIVRKIPQYIIPHVVRIK